MTTETLIQKVRKEVGELDERSRQLLATAMKIIQNDANGGASPSAHETFLGCNASLDEYRAFSRPERRRYQSEAEALNQKWLDERFQALGANWIMVIDGRIIKHGTSLGDYPREAEIRELQEKTGKCPFVFFSKFLLAIEEVHTPWLTTNKTNGHYPTHAAGLRLAPKRGAIQRTSESRLEHKIGYTP